MGPPTATPSPASPETHRGAFIIRAPAVAPRGGCPCLKEGQGGFPAGGWSEELGTALHRRASDPALRGTASGCQVQHCPRNLPGSPLGSVLHSPWILLPEVRAVQMWSPRTSCLTCRAQVPHLSTALARKERGEQAACQSALDSGCTTWSSRSSSFEMEMPGSQNGPVTATPSQEVEQSAFNGRPADQNIPVGSRHRSPTC